MIGSKKEKVPFDLAPEARAGLKLSIPKYVNKVQYAKWHKLSTLEFNNYTPNT